MRPELPAARGGADALARGEARLAWLLVAPAVGVVLVVALLPIGATVWEALHGHDLRLPWLGQPFVGLANFAEALGDDRFRDALLHTAVFALVSVPLELALGLALALVMQAPLRAIGVLRAIALLPWAVPTVVTALIWRFMTEAGPAHWLADAQLAWLPLVAADVWKTAPFAAILLLAGLQGIDPALHEAARVDGAGAIRRFCTITLPLLGPSLVVAGTFRALDALRLFDLAYVLTSGGPGTATEPLSLYAFIVLMQRLRFGYGSALSVTVFLLTFGFALLCVRALRQTLEGTDA
ncbi:MAG: carbohydrate ABC transporter permease [Vicinamibacterales bacterium]